MWLQRRLLDPAFDRACYAIVFTSFVLFEKPGLGLGHFFYIPVALLALAGGARFGLFGGILATALYTLAIAATPRVPTGDVMTLATAIRLVTYSLCGALVGWFASEHRRHLGQLRELADRDFLTGLVNARVFDDTLAERCHAGEPSCCCSATWTTSRRSTTRTAIRPATRSCAVWPTRCSRERIPPMRSRASAATSSPSSRTQACRREPIRCARLRAELEELDLHVSFGWAAFPDDAAGPVELFRKADDRLYAAKLIQRNHRVVEQLDYAGRPRTAAELRSLLRAAFFRLGIMNAATAPRKTTAAPIHSAGSIPSTKA